MTRAMPELGKVSLVGAGPGDPGLITVKGRAALRDADVVVYDRLAPAALLAETRPDAALISAAKAPGAVALTQDQINRLLIEHARQGRAVCRLKGGDPFVFGRGGEEAIALAEAGVPFEVVPGVTSAIGAPAYAGIPVTHRGVASAVTVVTGSEAPDADSPDVNWRAIARTGGTIVVLMGATKISQIAESLIRHGRPPTEPAAAIHRGTSTRQRTVTGTLRDIAARVQSAEMTAPITFVVGDVVNLRDAINWFDTIPLFGKRVLVTRARSQASRLATGLAALGAEVVECPVIRSAPVDDPSELDAALADVGSFDWMAVASPNSVRQVFARLEALGCDARALADLQIAAVGPATVDALRRHGVIADLVPDTYTAAGLVEAFVERDISPRTAIVFKSDIGRETLPDGLRELGTEVTEVVAYRTVAEADSTAKARAAYRAGIDVTTFTSSSTVKNLVGMLDGDVTRINDGLVVCMGPVTSKTAASFGIAVDVVPAEQSIPGMISAIAAHYSEPS